MDRSYAIHVLKLPATFDLTTLRLNYKRMALLLHPDRRTLDAEDANRLFSILTDSYKLLKSELEGEGGHGGITGSRDGDADWRSMRELAKADSQATRPGPGTGGGGGGGKFNIDSFNTTFSDTRLGDENDRGYSSWMERLTPDAAPGHQKRRQEDSRRRAADAEAKGAVAMYEPEAMLSSTSVPHSELGTGRVRDFGRATDICATGGADRRMPYTDYKVAHMTASCLIDPEIVRARQQFDSVEAYEQARARSSSDTMTADEGAAIARRERTRASQEDRRLHALRSRDELVSRHHAKIHAHMLM